MPASASRALWAGAAAILAVAALAAIAIVVSGDLGDREARIIVSMLAVFLCGGAAVAGIALLDRERVPLLGAIVLAVSGANLVVFLLAAWKAQFGNGANGYFDLLVIALAWAVATVVVATLPLLAADGRLRRTMLPAVGICAFSGATIATALVWARSDSGGWEKMLTVLAILMVAGHLLTPVLDRLLRHTGPTTRPH